MRFARFITTVQYVVASAAAFIVAVPANTAPVTSLPTIDPARLETVIDKRVKLAMGRDHLAGVTVSVVHRGRLVFAKGYGYANLERKVKVDPQRTIFHIGSVTKLFTATATMQLWEQGKIRLDRDVGNMVDFKWPRPYPQPITMAHLMTHTAGFEESFLGFISGREDLKSLRDVTQLTIPKVGLVRPAGIARSYSNHGILLEGYIVERSAGQPFGAYVRDHIFQPLGMNRSAVEEPMPASLRPDLSNGYAWIDGAYQKLPDDYINLAPAGSISSTADDMARFMLAHLQDGRVGERQILKPQTAALMHSCHFVDHPLANNCMAFGFFRDRIAGHVALTHNGGTFSFLSNLVLLPDQEFGIFIGVNSPSDGGLTDELPKQVVKTMFGAVPLPNQTAPFTGTATDYEGHYAPMRRFYSGWLKITGLGTADVTATGAHSLKIDGVDAVWKQVGPDAFRSSLPEAEGITLVFRRDGTGRVVGASLGDGFDKVPAFATLNYAFGVLIAFGVATLALAGLLLVHRKSLLARGHAVRSVTLPMVAGVVFFLVGISLIATYAMNDTWVRGYTQPLGVSIAVWTFNISALMFIVGATNLVRHWRGIPAGWVSRSILIAFAVASLLLTAFLAYWNLIALSA